MGSALRVVGRSFRDWWDEMFLMVGVNLMWALLALPVVTIFPATMGAMNVAHHKAHGRRVEFDHFWQGFRQYFGKAWVLGAINVVVLVMIGFNILFYLNQPNWLFYLSILWLYLLLLWLGLQMYVFPLAIEQDDKSVKLIYRNAALLAVGRPLFTLVVAVIQVLLLAVSIALSPLLLLVYVPLSSLIANHALIDSLANIEERRTRAARRQAEAEGEPEPRRSRRKQRQDR